MNLKKFSEQHGGIQVLARRHFEYEKPVAVPTTEAGGNLSIIGSLVYTRALDPAKLGLSPLGARHAYEQGKLLVSMGVIPRAIVCGIDQRNRDGARFSAAGIEEVTDQAVCYFTSPAVTYPYYSDEYQLDTATQQ